MQIFNRNFKLDRSSNFPLPDSYKGPHTRSRVKEATGFARIEGDVGVALTFFKKLAGLESSPQLIRHNRNTVTINKSSLEVWIGRAAVVVVLASLALNSRL